MIKIYCIESLVVISLFCYSPSQFSLIFRIVIYSDNLFSIHFFDREREGEKNIE